MFKKIKQGKMLEINERKASACGGHVNTLCANCGTHECSRGMQRDGYFELKEKWGE